MSYSCHPCSMKAALICIYPQQLFHMINLLGLGVLAEIQGREVWWHPQVEAPQPELCGLSPQDHQSRRRRVSRCCQGNAPPDESNSTYHFVTHWSTWRLPHTHTYSCEVCLCQKHALNQRNPLNFFDINLFFANLFALGFNSSYINVSTACKS